MPIFISSRSQRGASSLENTVIILVFLFLFLASYESVHWLLLRQALNTALLDTARIAATQGAHPQIIHEAFTQQLQRLPSFALQPDPAYWQIEKHRTTLSDDTTTIQFDYQGQQYNEGNTDIFNANTLHLRLHYIHVPATPLLRSTIRALLSFVTGRYQSVYAQGYLPIVTDIQVAMQSDHRAAAYVAHSPSQLITASSVPPWADSLFPPPEFFAPQTVNTNTWQPPTYTDTPLYTECAVGLCCQLNN